MPGIYAGDTKCLVFPVMCDGYLKLPYYDKNSPDTELDLRGGLWGHQGKFSIEAILSPYDVNGFGTKAGASGIGYATSERTPPSLDQTHPTNVNDEHYQSEKYFSHVERKTHRMYLFSNPNFKLYLENTTLNNFNQPAEYKIVVSVAGSTPISSSAVIKAHNTLYGKYDINGLYEGSTTSLTELDNLTFLSTEGGVTITCDSTATIGTGTEIFNSNGISLGLATVTDATHFTLTSATNWTNALYVSQLKEALYMETLYKVGFSYSAGNVSLYLNNKLVGTGTVTPKTFEAGNCYIGQNVTQGWTNNIYGTGTPPDETSRPETQFMGELYEICMYKRTEPTFSIHTLSPGYNDIIFYYRFGDE